MRVVYIVRQFPRTSETFVLREVRELARRGIDVTVWSLLPPDPGEPPAADAGDALRVTRYAPAGGARTRAFAGALLRTRPRRLLAAAGWAAAWSAHERDWRHLAAVPYAAWIARRVPPGAHVHAHFANIPATVALLVGRLAGTRWSFTGHANDMFVGTSRRLLAHKVRAASVAVVGTAFAQAHVRRVAGPDHADRVVLVRNGLDASELVAARVPERDPRGIVAVGRLVEKKGLDTLVSATAALVGRGHEVTVRIVGEGPLRGPLERQVAALGLGGRVHLLGARDAATVRRELAGATVFALPCRVDAQGDVDTAPLAIVEAMAQRAAVVTTPVGGITEMVRDGDSGLLVAPDDPEALATAIARLLDDDALREQVVAGALAVVDEFALAPNVDRLLELFAGP